MIDKLMRFNWFQHLVLFLQKHRAFNSKQNWFDFLRKVIAKITDPDTSERSAAVAYNLILAVFPAIIFLFTLIPYIPIPNIEAQIMEFLGRVLPASTYDTVKATIYDIISRPRGSILSVGFLLALYAATSGILSLMAAFNSSHRVGDDRGFLKTRLIAAGLTLMLTFALFLAVTVLVVGGLVSEYLQHFRIFDNQIFYFLFDVVRYLVVLLVFVGAIAVIYRFGPDVDMKWTFITPGSIITSLLIVLTTYGFSYYVSNFGSYNKLYGSIGTLIVLMIWLNLVCTLLIMGFEMNVALYNLEGEKNPQVEEKTINAPVNT